jgi:hypothetical protein
VPYNKYRVIAPNDTTFPISNKLQTVHDKVLVGNFVDAKLHPEYPSQSMLALTLERQVRLKRQRIALARRAVIRDEDVKRRGSGATVDARAMEIVIRSLGLFGLLLLRILGVGCVNRIECFCHLNKTIYI